MRRAQATLALAALLLAPLALLARASAPLGDCDSLCCLPHGSHHAPAHPGAMHCHHGSAGHAARCTMKAGHHVSDYALIVPIAPLAPATSAAVALASSRRVVALFSASLPLGFLSIPFQPPRT
jgi:hypothetical protein